MEFGNPLLPKLKYPLVILGSTFAAWVGYTTAVSQGFGVLVSVIFAVGAFIGFGFIQGLMPILNFVGLPLASFFLISIGGWGYWLGGISLVIFLLTKFRYARPA